MSDKGLPSGWPKCQRAVPPADPIEALAAAIEATFPTLPDSVRAAWLKARNALGPCDRCDLNG